VENISTIYFHVVHMVFICAEIHMDYREIGKKNHQDNGNSHHFQKHSFSSLLYRGRALD
jgi:hypothetical protein